MKKLFFIFVLILGTVPLGDFGLALAGTAPKPRYISLAPSTTEILFALGLEGNIAGITTFCNYPAETKSIEKVGTFSDPDIEKILSLKPDLIFATGLEQAPTVSRLRQLQLKVTVSDPSNFSELFLSIREIGRLTLREKEAEELITKMQEEINKVREKVKEAAPGARPKVFLEIWHDPLMTLGRNSFVDELITLAGGVNIAHDIQRPYSYFSAEQVIKRDPDCIILSHSSAKKAGDFVKGRLGWKEIKAVKNNRVFNDIDPDLFLRPGPRLVWGLEEIHRRLYSE